jgi:fibro-slime domain-containing protein
VSRLVLASSLFLGLLALSSCGARTELAIPELCRVVGETRPCADACGAGEQTCTDGAWSACEVPVATRGCADECGAGLETCESGAWSACQVPLATRPCQSVCGPGQETCRDGAWHACDAPQPRPPELAATVRDFSPLTHPDFEASYAPGLDLGIVQSLLGADDKPQYTTRPRTKSTSGAANFDTWYRKADVNEQAPLELQLLASADDAGSFVYDNHAFFPIDGQLLGNEGNSHNYHFTLEASTTFQYVGGEVFSFSGDDDMWVFINRQLVIDLGGLHPSMDADVALDDVAQRLKLTRGQVYPLHFFFAERHTDASNFTIRTTIAEPGSCQ